MSERERKRSIVIAYHVITAKTSSYKHACAPKKVAPYIIPPYTLYSLCGASYEIAGRKWDMNLAKAGLHALIMH